MKYYSYIFLKADGTEIAVYSGTGQPKLQLLLMEGWIALREVVISSDSVFLILESP